MTKHFIAVALALALGVGEAFAQTEESALDRFIRARQGIQTGVVHYTLRMNRDGKELNYYHIDRVGGRGEVVTYYGPNGIVRSDRTPDDPTEVNYTDGERRLIRGYRVGYSLQEFELGPATSPDMPSHPRLRSFGAALYPSRSETADAIWCPDDLERRPCAYSEQESNGLVVAALQAGPHRIVYWLDAERDFNPICIASEHHGRIGRQTHITLEQFDGVWFPRRVVHYYPKSSNDGQAQYEFEVIDVLDAAFNRPEHPNPLTPYDAGFLAGSIVWAGENGPRGPSPTWTSTGEVVTHDEWVRRVRAGEDRIAPALLGWSAERQTAAGRMSAWERYTYAFIARNAFDDDQRERALDVLRECQERGHRYLERNSERIRKAELRVAESRKDSQAAEELEALLLPLDEIFEARLKPGLERLLTPEQRRAAGPAASARGR